MVLLHMILKYLRKRQPPKILFFHILILLLVLLQIFVSNFMDFTRTGEIPGKVVQFYGTWTHIVTGLSLLPIVILFILLVLKEHGFAYFYPYLFGDFRQMKSDIAQLKKINIPEPEPGGIAAIVKGLGLVALLLALLAGLMWFLAWRDNLQWSHYFKELHEMLVGVVEAYVIGHGGMGLLHIFLISRKRDRVPPVV